MEKCTGSHSPTQMLQSRTPKLRGNRLLQDNVRGFSLSRKSNSFGKFSQLPTFNNMKEPKVPDRDTTHLRDTLDPRSKSSAGVLDELKLPVQVLPMHPDHIANYADSVDKLGIRLQCVTPEKSLLIHPERNNPLEKLIKYKVRSASFKDNLSQYFESSKKQGSLDQRYTLRNSTGTKQKEFVYFGAPTGRQEVTNLIDWFNCMKENYLFSVFQTEIESSELELGHSILQLGLNEILRQVSVACNDRGRILKELLQFYTEFIQLCGHLKRDHLVTKIESLTQQIELTKKTNENAHNSLLQEIQNLRKMARECQRTVELKDQAIEESKSTVKQLENEKEFLLTTDIKLYDDFNVEKGTTNLKQLLSNDTVSGFKIRKIYNYFANKDTSNPPHSKRRQLKPKYSKRLEQIELMEPFFQNKEVQTEAAAGTEDASTSTYLLTLENDTQTESPTTDENASSRSSRDNESLNIPNAIIVTTDKNETIVEYAFVPNKKVLSVSSVEHSEPECPLLIEELLRLRPCLDSEVSHLEVEDSPYNDTTFSNLSASDSSEDGPVLDVNCIETLIVPGIEQNSSETPKQHSLNPDPYTSIAPTTWQRSALKKHEAVQTDNDLLLEIEEREIIDQMIDYKKELLRKADQELVVTKSKLISLTKKFTLTENSLSVLQQTRETDRKALEELYTSLIDTGQLPGNTEYATWKHGFLQGHLHATGDPYTEEEDAKLYERTAGSSQRPELKRLQTLAKFREFNFHHPERKVIRVTSHPAHYLLHSLSQKQSDINKYNTLCKKMMLKKLNLIYSSAISRENNGEILPPLAEYSYNYIQSRHSETLIGDKKYLELVYTALRHCDSLKASIFIRLVGLGACTDSEDYIRPSHAFSYYIQLISLISRSKTGIVLHSHDTGEIQYIPKNRALECVREVLGKVFKADYVQYMCKAIEKVSRQDPFKINTNGVVNQDFVLELVMEEYDKHSRDVLDAVSLVVQGFDLLKHGHVHPSEVVMVVRHLNRDALGTLLEQSEGLKESFTKQFSEIITSSAKGDYVEAEDMAEFFIKKSVLGMAQVREYMSESSFPDSQVKDKIQSSLIQRVETINLVLQHKAQLDISPEVESLWKSKIELLGKDAERNPRALNLAFTIFMNELERLRALIK